MDKLILIAEKRNLSGRKVNKLRKEGIIPANVFGNKIKSESIQVKNLDFDKTYKEAGETGLIELHINSDKKPVLIHNVQVDPVNEKILHVDFLQVNLKEKVTASIPIEFIGDSPVEKQGLGTVVQYMDEVEVEALPTDLPEKFEVDINTFTEIDQTAYLKDLKIDKSKVEIKEDLEKIIAKAEPVKEEKEEIQVTEQVVATEGEETSKTETLEPDKEKTPETDTSKNE